MFGFNQKTMVTDIGMLSDGQKTRLVFAIMGMNILNESFWPCHLNNALITI